MTVLDVKAALESNAYLLPKMNQIGAHLMRQQQPLGPRLSDDTPASSSSSSGQSTQGAGGGIGGLGLGTADDSFSGALYVTVRRLDVAAPAPESLAAGLGAGERLGDVYISLEVDSFGQFFFQAKTPGRPLSDTITWDDVRIYALIQHL